MTNFNKSTNPQVQSFSITISILVDKPLLNLESNDINYLERLYTKYAKNSNSFCSLEYLIEFNNYLEKNVAGALMY